MSRGVFVFFQVIPAGILQAPSFYTGQVPRWVQLEPFGLIMWLVNAISLIHTGLPISLAQLTFSAYKSPTKTHIWAIVSLAGIVGRWAMGPLDRSSDMRWHMALTTPVSEKKPQNPHDITGSTSKRSALYATRANIRQCRTEYGRLVKKRWPTLLQ